MSQALLAELEALAAERPPDALERAAMSLVHHVGDVAAIARIAGDMLEPLAFGHPDPSALEALRRSYPSQPLGEARIAQLLLRSDGPVVIPKMDPREFQTLSATEYARDHGVYAMAMALVRDADGEPRGIVSISREHRGAPYGDDEKRLIAAVAERLVPLLA